MPATRLVPIYEIRLARTGSLHYAARPLTNPEAVATVARETLAERLAEYDREHFVAFYVSSKLRLVGYAEISVGTLTATLVSPREVFKGAILCNAHGVIVAHNHPSGDPTPSPEDRRVTERLAQAGSVLDIQLLDHIIIGHDGRYYSFRERGFFA